MPDQIAKMSAALEAHPDRSPLDWARLFEISRPYFYDLKKGVRNPSLKVALRIEAVTDGAVKVRDWPNHAAVISATTSPKDTRQEAGV